MRSPSESTKNPLPSETLWVVSLTATTRAVAALAWRYTSTWGPAKANEEKVRDSRLIASRRTILKRGIVAQLFGEARKFFAIHEFEGQWASPGHSYCIETRVSHELPTYETQVT